MGLFCGVRMWLHVEDEVAFEEEALELGGVITREGRQGLGITFFGQMLSRSWSRRRLEPAVWGGGSR